MLAPQISVEPEIKYYDLQKSTFKTFGKDDYNKLNARVVAKLSEKVEKSDLKSMACKELEITLNNLQIVGKEPFYPTLQGKPTQQLVIMQMWPLATCLMQRL